VISYLIDKGLRESTVDNKMKGAGSIINLQIDSNKALNRLVQFGKFLKKMVVKMGELNTEMQRLSSVALTGGGGGRGGSRTPLVSF
jgi:hypothetical protein